MAAKKKRNPNGSGTISLREDGRYELKVFVDTPDGRRKRISVYGSTWEEADAERTRVKELQRKAIPVESTTTTVADDELMTIRRQHRREQLANPAVARGNTLGLVFTTKNGTPLEPRNVNRAFESLCRRAGVRPIRLHDLRHSCATLLFTMGVDAATVQRILRHSSISVTTGTYVEMIERVQRDAVSGMDSLLKQRGVR
jgi:integrase